MDAYEADADEGMNILPETDWEFSAALLGKRYCDKLFGLEGKFTNLSTDERHAQRQDMAKSVVDEFIAWAASVTLFVAPKAIPHRTTDAAKR